MTLHLLPQVLPATQEQQLTPTAIEYFPELKNLIKTANEISSSGEGSPDLIPVLMREIADIIQHNINTGVDSLFAS